MGKDTPKKPNGPTPQGLKMCSFCLRGWRILPKAKKGQEGERARRQISIGGLFAASPAWSRVLAPWSRCPDQNPNGAVSHGFQLCRRLREGHTSGHMHGRCTDGCCWLSYRIAAVYKWMYGMLQQPSMHTSSLSLLQSPKARCKTRCLLFKQHT